MPKSLIVLCFLLLFSAGTATSLAQTGPPPIPPVESVTPMGTVTQSPIIQGRDGTASALLNGKSVWVFGDTSMTKYNALGKNFIDNSMAWATHVDAANGITLDGNYVDSTRVPTEFMPYLPWEAAYNAAHSSSSCTAKPCGAEFAMWPGPILPDPARGRALIFYTEIWRVTGQSSGQILEPASPSGRMARSLDRW